MYRIAYCVAVDGRFLFRTEQRLETDYPKLFEKLLTAKFPADEGFTVTREEYPAVFTSKSVSN